MTTILLVPGSLRRGSTNAAVLRTARALAPGDVEAVLYEGLGALPLFNPDDDEEGAAVPAAVAELRAAVAGADALLVCTPEYAGALPAALKNLLEWTIGDAGTYGKPVAWINAAGAAAPTGAADAHARCGGCSSTPARTSSKRRARGCRSRARRSAPTG